MTHAHAPINPIPDLNNHPSDWYGLTKREYFAAMAMQGIIAGNKYCSVDPISRHSVILADALIEELNKKVWHPSTELPEVIPNA